MCKHLSIVLMRTLPFLIVWCHTRPYQLDNRPKVPYHIELGNALNPQIYRGWWLDLGECGVSFVTTMILTNHAISRPAFTCFKMIKPFGHPGRNKEWVVIQLHEKFNLITEFRSPSQHTLCLKSYYTALILSSLIIMQNESKHCADHNNFILLHSSGCLFPEIHHSMCLLEW